MVRFSRFWQRIIRSWNLLWTFVSVAPEHYAPLEETLRFFQVAEDCMEQHVEGGEMTDDLDSGSWIQATSKVTYPDVLQRLVLPTKT